MRVGAKGAPTLRQPVLTQNKSLVGFSDGLYWRLTAGMPRARAQTQERRTGVLFAMDHEK
jgi:hypothetical protein